MEGYGRGGRDADRSSKERWAAGVLGGVAVLAAGAVKAWLRPFVHEIGLEEFGLLGWAPSFLIGLGLPYLFVARNVELPAGPSPRGSFGADCFWAWMILWSLELLDLLLMRPVFDVGDLLASLLGVVAAWGLHRAIWPRPFEVMGTGGLSNTGPR